MKKNEFDIQVRNLLQNAQESVSPSVWEGVQAGLARKRRAAAFWRWTGAVAAAAAVLGGVVLLWPADRQEHSNPIIILAETPSEDLMEVPAVQVELLPAGETAAPSTPQVNRPVRLAQVAKKPAAAPVAQETAPVQESVPVQDAAPVQEASPMKDATSVQEVAPVRETASQPRENDQVLFNQLAYEEESKYNAGKGWSLAVSGNLEDKRRNTLSSYTATRYSAPPLSATEGIYNESPEVSFSLPFSVGVGLDWQFAKHWAVGLGLRYTNLSRTFVGDYVGDGYRLPQTDIDNHQHWLGIPVNVYYAFVNTSRWRVHVFTGGSMEFLVDNDYLVHGTQKDIHYHQRGTRPQFSAGLGLGVEFKITPWLGVYLDPSFRYYFRPDLQPRSLRTIQPLRFDIEAGLRFSLGK